MTDTTIEAARLTNEQRAEAAATDVVNTWSSLTESRDDLGTIIARHYAEVFEEVARLRSDSALGKRHHICGDPSSPCDYSCMPTPEEVENERLRIRLAKLVEATREFIKGDDCVCGYCDHHQEKLSKAIAEATA
jgi:hypothetical protein